MRIHAYIALLLAVTYGILSNRIKDEVQEGLKLDVERVQKWANSISTWIYNLTTGATAVHTIQDATKQSKYRLEKFKGRVVLRKFVSDIEAMLRKKRAALLRLVKEAEKIALQKPEYSPQFGYYNAKKLVSENELGQMNGATVVAMESEYRYLNLSIVPHFPNSFVNMSISTVHVPTNVYDKSTDVIKGIVWSKKLDTVFRRNRRIDPSLTWQYFGSSSGFYRIFPGLKWPRTNSDDDNVDMFDCRSRGWYLQAATFPKNMVILLDTSGSMTGLRMSIAKRTVGKLLDTLSNYDYFNVIHFNEEPAYVDECANQTLIQCTSKLRRHMQSLVTDLPTTGIANFSKAFIEAFNLFEKVSHKSHCNNIIMLITDGASENYVDVFKKYNWEQGNKVRVFTYLIGREVSDKDKRQVNWMACANRGSFKHISTLGDVQENVQKYVQVLSLPLANWTSQRIIWTPVYQDFLNQMDRDDQNMRLVTTVAQPVFNKSFINGAKGDLLGVMGVDVPIMEYTQLIPKLKLGVNGYAFAITRNGYVLFHPQFLIGKGLKVDTDNKDIEEDLMSVDLTHVEHGAKAQTMQDDMITGKTGRTSMKVNFLAGNTNRVMSREYKYFYTPINGTPFSAGIAVPRPYSKYFVKGTLKYRDWRELLRWELERFTNIAVAAWPYCPSVDHTHHNDIGVLMRNLHANAKNCDQQLVGSVMLDIRFTRPIISVWQNSTRHLAGEGVELVFLGTRAGLTRWHRVARDPRDYLFLLRNLNTADSMYYRRTVDETWDAAPSEKIIVWSQAPSVNGSEIVTMTMPITLQQRPNPEERAPFGVVGLQMTYANFSAKIKNIITKCPRGRCNRYLPFTCANLELSCYVVDNHGQVVYPRLTGESPEGEDLFLSYFDSALWNSLMEKNLFTGLEVIEEQDECQEPESPSSGFSLLNPFKQIFIAILNSLQVLISVFTQYVILLWQSPATAAAGDGMDSMDVVDYFADVDDDSLTQDERSILYYYKRPTRNLKRFICSRNATFYTDNSRSRSLIGTISADCHRCVKTERKCQNDTEDGAEYCNDECIINPCSRHYIVERIKRTNLLLIVATPAWCECRMSHDIEPLFRMIKRGYGDTDHDECANINEEQHSKIDTVCPSVTEEAVDETTCGAICQYVSLYIILASLYITSIL